MYKKHDIYITLWILSCTTFNSVYSQVKRRLVWVVIGNKLVELLRRTERDWRCIWLQFGVFVSLSHGFLLSCLQQGFFKMWLLGWIKHQAVRAVMLCYILCWGIDETWFMCSDSSWSIRCASLINYSLQDKHNLHNKVPLYLICL